mmetsp:Transcript_39835/g.127654  ORF Transcript_39835/g.127654 Transcript_39835/m.127654 type:complete len:297 (+) Transcript_39835:46-936(+)
MHPRGASSTPAAPPPLHKRHTDQDCGGGAGGGSCQQSGAGAPAVRLQVLTLELGQAGQLQQDQLGRTTLLNALVAEHLLQLPTLLLDAAPERRHRPRDLRNLQLHSFRAGRGRSCHRASAGLPGPGNGLDAAAPHGGAGAARKRRRVLHAEDGAGVPLEGEILHIAVRGDAKVRGDGVHKVGLVTQVIAHGASLEVPRVPLQRVDDLRQRKLAAELVRTVRLERVLRISRALFSREDNVEVQGRKPRARRVVAIHHDPVLAHGVVILEPLQHVFPEGLEHRNVVLSQVPQATQVSG